MSAETSKPTTVDGYIASFDDERHTGKGSIKLAYDEEIPAELLTEMIAHRIREFAVDGVKWM